jgi:hypothetical protein
MMAAVTKATRAASDAIQFMLGVSARLAGSRCERGDQQGDKDAQPGRGAERETEGNAEQRVHADQTIRSRSVSASTDEPSEGSRYSSWASRLISRRRWSH